MFVFQLVGGKEHASTEMTSDDDEEDAGGSGTAGAEGDKLSGEERRHYSEKKRSVRRKTHSPKRVQKCPPELPILDERYAASLLEYYSKHKPYYPVSEGDFNKHGEAEGAKVLFCLSFFIHVSYNITKADNWKSLY